MVAILTMTMWRTAALVPVSATWAAVLVGQAPGQGALMADVAGAEHWEMV